MTHPAVEVVLLLLTLFWYYVEAAFRLIIPNQKKVIRGKTVLITGAAGGIGQCLAREFYKNGSKLVLWDIDKEKLQTLATQISLIDKTVFWYVCDITNRQAVKDVANQVRRDVGDVDILVNNAGIMIGGEILTLDEKTIRNTFEINTISHFWTIQEFLPAMIKKNAGHIVTISSMAGVVGTPLLTEYCSSKFAAFGLSDSLGAELRRHGKDVNCTVICPFFVNTNLIHNEQFASRIESRPGKERIIEPTEVAEAVVEGVQFRRRRVYVPRKFALVRALDSVTPTKMRDTVEKYLETGVYSKSFNSTYT